MKKITIASRKSLLAMWQSEFVASELKKLEPNLETEILKMSTKGDVILDTPLAKIGGKNLFIKELEIAMSQGLAQISVHSLKDVGATLANDFVLAAIMPREVVNDVIVFGKDYKSFSDLPTNAKIGTTSLRRQMQLRAKNANYEVLSLRGNLQSRLQKLKDGEFDAIILAYAGLKRLDLLKEFNHEILSLDEMISAAGQGAVAIECINDKKVLEFVSRLNDEKTALLCKIERDFTATLNGGCGAPIGINASYLDDEKILIRAIVGLSSGKKFIQMQKTIAKENAHNFGVEFANEFIKNGALELLKENEKEQL